MGTYLAIAGLGAALAALQWTLYLRQQAAVEALDGRVAHLAAGVTLLTDTTEIGLRDAAVEIGRLAARPETARPAPRATAQRRVSGAARRGRSIQDIAAKEQMSEGEVRLRLNLADSEGETDDATLR